MKTKLGLSGLLGAGLAGAYLARKKLQGMAPKLPEVSPETVLLFQFAYSPYCIKVQHALRYKQIDFEVVELLPIVHSAYTQKVSGQPKVPYIQHRPALAGSFQARADSRALAAQHAQTGPDWRHAASPGGTGA
jgi:glutaredoxin